MDLKNASCAAQPASPHAVCAHKDRTSKDISAKMDNWHGRYIDGYTHEVHPRFMRTNNFEFV